MDEDATAVLVTLSRDFQPSGNRFMERVRARLVRYAN
jgi:hypothetical protein